jgi:aminopeptidase-like protein
VDSSGAEKAMRLESAWASQLDDSAIGDDIFALAASLYPICRSITGNGVRETLQVLARHIKMGVHEVPTGTQVFDWTIPHEWKIRDAYPHEMALFSSTTLMERKCRS